MTCQIVDIYKKESENNKKVERQQTHISQLIEVFFAVRKNMKNYLLQNRNDSSR